MRRSNNLRDATTDLGPLVDRAAARRVMLEIQQARADGASLLTGGWSEGNRLAPTWLEDVPEDHRLLREEVFGPVANAAAVIVNDSTDFRIDAMPFGGGGAAGLGRKGLADAIEAMAEKKMYVVRRTA